MMYKEKVLNEYVSKMKEFVNNLVGEFEFVLCINRTFIENWSYIKNNANTEWNLFDCDDELELFYTHQSDYLSNNNLDPHTLICSFILNDNYSDYVNDDT